MNTFNQNNNKNMRTVYNDDIPVPFQDSPRIRRSPVSTTKSMEYKRTPEHGTLPPKEVTTTPNANTPIATPQSSVRKCIEQEKGATGAGYVRTPVNSTAIPLPTATETTVGKTTHMMSGPLIALGKEIDELMRYCNSQRNMHKDVIRRCSVMKRLHTEVLIQFEKEEKWPRIRANPSAVTSATTQAKQTSAVSHGAQSTKRTRTKSSPKEAEKGKSPAAKKQRALEAVTTPITTNVAATKDSWIKVQRNPKTKQKAIKPRADAIIIATKDVKASYANILRAVKTSAELKTLGKEVRTIRRTQKGELLLELNRTKDVSAVSLQTSIEEVLKDVAIVKVRTHMITVQCKGLVAEINTKEELLDALEEQAKIRRPQDSAIRSMRNTYGGTQTAYIMLPAEDAKKVLALNQIRVGWVRCRVSESISPTRCFRCWGYGHIAASCKETDRTGLCRRCGESGHVAASCDERERCALCKGAHAAGSTKCPRYQEARIKRRS